MIADEVVHAEATSTLDQTLLATTAEINRRLSAYENSRDAVLTMAIDSGLGWYTVEQEADELAAEWLRDLGIDPSVAESQLLKFALKADHMEHLAFGEITGSRCQELARNDWRDADGRHVMPPIAAWYDLHHSPCFRAFNVDREIKVHALGDFGNHRRPDPGSPAWDEIVQSVFYSPDPLHSQPYPGRISQ